MAKANRHSREQMELPDRFKDDEDDDVDDGTGVGGDDVPFVQQSVYGMLAATQTGANFSSSRFQQESGSESEGNEEEYKRRTVKIDTQRRQSKVDASDAGANSESSRQTNGSGEVRRQRKRLDDREGKPARSFFKPVRGRADSQPQDPMTQSQFLPPRPKVDDVELSDRPSKEAPILDRKLQAMARAAMESSIASSSGTRRSTESGRPSLDSLKGKESMSLAQVIANIFQLDEPEEVVSEYPCWYLQNILLQGYMYITVKHVCFYSYLQKKTNVTVKTGHLGKQARHGYRYRRYWFILKGDTFAYYKGSAEPYFPIGSVDLKYAISADLSKDQGAVEDATDFTITTPSRVYYYRADTATSARDWVKHLQKIIFRSHNDGDSVKISLPIESIVDVEQTSVVDFAETVKLRVVANDETYAVDEYFFTFFSRGQDALKMLKVLAERNGIKDAAKADDELTLLQKSPTQWVSPKGRSPHSDLALLQEQGPEQSTQSPQTAGDLATQQPSSGLSRTGVERERRGSGGRRRSQSARSDRSASHSSTSPKIDQSRESFMTMSEQAASSSTGEELLDDDMSASQMLSGDSVFRGPTIRMPQPRRSTNESDIERFRREFEEPSGESSTERVKTQASTKQRTGQALEQGRSGLHREAGRETSHPADSVDNKLHATHPPAPGRLVRGISTPLQHAMTVAGIVRSSGKRMSTYLNNSPKTYIDNWSAAIIGGKRHYTGAEGLAPDDSIREPELEMDVAEHERRFQEHFGLPPTEKLASVFYCWLHKTVPLYGKIYMGTRRFCFRSLWYGTKTKLVIPFKDILNVHKQRGFRWGYPGMVLVIRGYEELFFDFPSVGLRDDAVVTVLRSLETVQVAAESMILTEAEQQDAEDAAAENELLLAVRKDGKADHDLQLPRNVHQTEPDAPPILFDDPSASVLDFKPSKPMRITCLTIGSRGDVQPYIALCKGLQAEGHKCKIATHLEFRDWVERHGIEFAEINGDPAELMRLCIENGMFTPAFLLEVNSTFRVWLDELLQTAWKACMGADLLIESPSAMCGIHIAEALEIPYFRAFTMPWTRTRAYPHAFAVPNSKMGGGYNYMTYTLFDNIFWQAIAWQINRWRGKTLGLGPTSLDKLQQNKVPFLYNFSPSVVVPPLDFSDWIKITGYWFLDEGEEWEPSKELAAFIKKARQDEQKLVYIGFGSVTVSDSRLLMQQIVDAVVKADVRCILAKGWSDRYDKHDASAAPIEVPPSIHQIRSAPHDWLFKQVDAVVHHGGAGTTGASLRAGKPTIIKPFFGDQFFFATRVEDLGVGTYLKKVTANQLGRALWIATHDARMRTKAALLGESIRAENGVQTAINAIYRDLDYAKTLIKKRGQKSAVAEGAEEEASSEDTEENWTFVEMEGDADLVGAGRRDHVTASPHGSEYARQSETVGSTAIRNKTRVG